MTHSHAPTPLERFLDVLQAYPHAGLVTETGGSLLLRNVASAMPFLPAIIANGEWRDWTEGAPEKAIDAVMANEAAPENPEDADCRLPEATYLVGLLTGLALAHALAGCTDGRGTK